MEPQLTIFFLWTVLPGLYVAYKREGRLNAAMYNANSYSNPSTNVAVLV